MKTSRYICPDGHVTTVEEASPGDAITCTHPHLGDDADPLIDTADICGKRATRQPDDVPQSAHRK